LAPFTKDDALAGERLVDCIDVVHRLTLPRRARPNQVEGRRVGGGFPTRSARAFPNKWGLASAARRGVRLAALGALAFARVAGAASTWTPPQQLSSGGIALGPELAANGSGAAVAVWDEETGPDCATSPASLSCIHTIETAYRTRAGDAWETGHAIARPGVGARPQTAINGVGDAALLWVHDIGTYRVVQATLRRGLGGEFPNPNDLSDSVLEVRSH